MVNIRNTVRSFYLVTITTFMCTICFSRSEENAALCYNRNTSELTFNATLNTLTLILKETFTSPTVTCKFNGTDCFIDCTKVSQKINSTLANCSQMQISSSFNQGNSFFTVASENWNTSSTCNITVCNESDITNTLNSLKNNPNVLDVIQKLPILKKSCNFTEDLNNTYTYNEIQKKVIQNVMNMDFSGNNITVTTPEVAIVVYKMKITSTTPQEIDIAMPQVSTTKKAYTPEIRFPLEALSKNNNNTEKRVAVACFESADQFKTAAGEEVRSMVIQIEVVGETISGLKNPLTLNFPLYNKTDANYTETCKFYNSESVWSTDGCNTNKTNTTVICTCNHMTPFAVLMVPVGKISEPDWQILSILSYIGCGLSAGFTAISVLTYFILRSPKRDHSYTIHVCLSAALYMLNMTFLLNEWLTSKAMSTLCTFIAVFMHYSLLSCFTWMAIEAVHLYLLMIKVFNTYIRHYISKLSVAGWGIPAVIVGISMALNGKYEIYGVLSTSLITSNASASSQSKHQVCWIMNQNFLYGVNIAYFGIIFLFNMGILITVAVKIGQLRRFGKSSDKGVLWKDVCTVTGLTCLLGTTWGLAFFGHGVFTTPVLYMFTIFNSLQGFFIFLWTCASSSKGVKTNDFKSKSSYAGCETSSIAKPKEVLFPELNSDPYK